MLDLQLLKWCRAGAVAHSRTICLVEAQLEIAHAELNEWMDEACQSLRWV